VPTRRRADAGRDLPAEVAALRARVDALDAELDESRALDARLTAVTGAVAELLLPPSQQDPARVRRALQSRRAAG
jgi:hypothetical protein